MSQKGEQAYWRRTHPDEVNRRHLEAKRRASESGRKTNPFNPKPLDKDEESWLRKAIKAMDPRLWKSRATLEHEKKVEEVRLQQEAAEKAKNAEVKL